MFKMTGSGSVLLEFIFASGIVVGTIAVVIWSERTLLQIKQFAESNSRELSVLAEAREYFSHRYRTPPSPDNTQSIVLDSPELTERVQAMCETAQSSAALQCQLYAPEFGRQDSARYHRSYYQLTLDPTWRDR